jgi:hypothetical protein
MNDNTPRPVLVKLGLLGSQGARHRPRFYMDLHWHCYCYCIGDSSLLDWAGDASRSCMVLVRDALDGSARRLEMTGTHFTFRDTLSLTNRWSQPSTCCTFLI